ncbi:hypothetical protein GAI60_04395 [Escherichia coli]|nr:hypothetical protein [Escherichia coli]
MSRKSYPNVNAANQYVRDVVRGKIVACQFVIQACQRHLDDLMAEKSKSFRYRFDKDLAERAAKFIQLLPHTKGEWAFKRMPITLEPWQLFVICCAFGWVNKGSRLRRFREVYTEIPRKNGKSAISAGVALYCFACDMPAATNTTWMTCGDPCDSALRIWGDTVVECVLNKLCPSHTYVIFKYPE